MKKIVNMLIAIPILLFPLSAGAKNLKQEKELTSGYSCETEQLIIPSYDDALKQDGYFSCMGNDFITCGKYDFDGNKIWSEYDPMNYLVRTSEIQSQNEYNLVVNGSNDILITKYPQYNTEEYTWRIQYGGNGIEKTLEIINYHNDDGELDGHLLFLYTTSTDIEGIKPGYVVVRYNNDGEKIWDKNIDLISNVIPLSDNNIITATITDLIKSNSEGIVWNVNTNMYINKVIESTTLTGEVDGYLVIGTGNVDLYDQNDYFHINYNNIYEMENIIDTKVLISKYDLAGNLVWQKEEPTNNIALYDIQISKNKEGKIDGYLAVGKVLKDGESYYKGLIIKYNLAGEVEWQEILESNTYELATITESYNQSLEQDGYIIAGLARKEEQEEKNNIEEEVSDDYEIQYRDPNVCENNIKVYKYVYSEEQDVLPPEEEKSNELEVNPETTSVGFALVFIILTVMIANLLVKVKNTPTIDE